MTTWRRGLGASATYQPLVSALAPAYNVPTPLALAVMQAESSGNPNAVSSAGAQGLFQVMPANDASLGISNAFDPSQNAAGGLSLLQSYYAKYGNWNQALEAFNEGPGNLDAQIAAGVTPTSAGYAAGILAASGITDSSPSDLSVGGDGTASVDSPGFLDSFAMAGLSGASVALIGLLGIGVLWAAAR